MVAEDAAGLLHSTVAEGAAGVLYSTAAEGATGLLHSTVAEGATGLLHSTVWWQRLLLVCCTVQCGSRWCCWSAAQ